MSFHLLLLLRWYHDTAVLLTSLDETDNLARIEILMHTDRLQSRLLLREALVVLHPLIELRVLVIADMDKVFL